MKRVLITFAAAATFAAGVVAAVGVFFSGADDSIVTDKPRPPQILITR